MEVWHSSNKILKTTLTIIIIIALNNKLFLF